MSRLIAAARRAVRSRAAVAVCAAALGVAFAGGPVAMWAAMDVVAAAPACEHQMPMGGSAGDHAPAPAHHHATGCCCPSCASDCGDVALPAPAADVSGPVAHVALTFPEPAAQPAPAARHHVLPPPLGPPSALRV